MRRNRAVVISVMVAVLASLGLARFAFGRGFIVKDGKPQAEIVITASPPRMVKLAADELQKYIQKITGARLPITTAPREDVPVLICVGRSPETELLGIGNVDLNYGAFRITSGEDYLVLLGRDSDFMPTEPWARNHGDQGRMLEEWHAITGGKWGNPIGAKLYRHHSGRMGLWEYDRGGSLNAVYEFLRSLGVRWYMPGELGEIVPEMSSIALPDVDTIVRPDFAVRHMSSALYGTSPPEDILWHLRLGLNHGAEITGPGGGVAHEMRKILGSPEIKDAHPKYYALYGGERATETGKPCLSSQGLFEENVKFVRALFDVYDTPMVSVMPPDGYVRPCECPLCEGKATPERGYHGRLSDYVWGYVNRVAKEVAKTHPDKKISCFAYGAYTLPPEKIDKLNPNIVVGIVHGRGKNFPDNPAIYRVRGLEKSVTEVREAWLEKTDNDLLIWEHYVFTHRGPYDGPVYFPHAIARGVHSLVGNCLGEFVEVAWGPFEVRGHGLHTPGFNHLNVYVTARSYWGAHADVDALLNEYYDTFYGPAAEEMKAFIEYSEANWHDLTKGGRAYPNFDRGKAQKAMALLAEAEQAAPADSDYAKRIALVVDYMKPLNELIAESTQGGEATP